MAKYHRNKRPWDFETYSPNCGRPNIHTTNKSYHGDCRVFSYRLTDINQLTSHGTYSVLSELLSNNFDDSVGVCFYKFEKNKRFLKIGECSNRSITKRFERGWDLKGKTNTDSYIYRQTKKPVTGTKRYKPMYLELKNISHENPAFFVFYEMTTEQATPKVDEFIAVEHHRSHFNLPTIQGDSVPHYRTGARLVWHDSAFDEVLKKQFPSGNSYP